jgi:ELWxxDGT repeat protein
MIKNVLSCKGRVFFAWPVIARVTGLSCLLSILSFSVQAQAELIKDIDQREEVFNNEFQILTAGTTNIFFSSWGSLWISNGSPETSVKLKSFKFISDITMVGNTAYFGADDGSGLELWKSTGTTSGTVRIKDIRPGVEGSNPQQLTNVNGNLYFTADNGKNGRELWRSNGTAAGTMMVKDILLVSGSSLPTALTNINGTLYFSANDGAHGYELWKTDGTATGTVMVKDIRPAAKVSSSPQSLTRSNGMLYFSALHDTGRELWKSDGTETGTVLVKDIRSGATSGDVENLIDVNGTLFFTANDGVHGDELWKSNGTEAGTVLVKDMNPGGAGSNNTNGFSGRNMNSFRNINGKLFFIASQSYLNYIYRSDGTEAGTVRVAPAFGTGLNYLEPFFTYLQGYVYFFNVDGVTNAEHEHGPLYLWKMPINSTTPTKVKRFYTPVDYGDSYYYENYNHMMVQCNGALYMVARLQPDQGFKFIRSDGTEAGTKIIADPDMTTLSSNPTDLVSANGFVFFRTRPDPYDYMWPSEQDFYSTDLYRTDGTDAGTIRMPGTFYDENEMEAVGNALYYTGAIDGWQLNKTDGINVSTIIDQSSGEAMPTRLTAVGNKLYYTNYLSELWRSDGTSAGTTMVRDFAQIISITDVGGLAYVLAETSAGDLELWRTTASGSVFRVKTIRTGSAIRSHYNPTTTDGTYFYFVANDGIHGNEVWRSDGTAATTRMLFDLNAYDPVGDGNTEVDIKSMTIAGRSLIVSAMDKDLNWAIHTYGTFSGILNSYSFGPETSDLIAVNNKAFFVVTTNLYAVDGLGAPMLLSELDEHDDVDYAVIGNNLYISLSPYSTYIWRTDGTECGTVPIFTGVGSSYPIAPLGNSLVMGGKEPYILRNVGSGTPCMGAATMASAETEEIIMTPYPNPFTNDFSLRVNGNDDEVADVGVYDISGLPIEKLNGIKTNTDHPNIGITWPKGMYIVKVYKGGKLSTHTVIKR